MILWYFIIGLAWSFYLERASRTMAPPLNEPWSMLQRVVSVCMWPVGVYNWFIGLTEGDDD